MKLGQIEKFYKKQARFYDFTRRFFLFNRKKAIEKLEIKEGDRVLDLACGTGLNIGDILKQTAPYNIVGIDYSGSMLEIARKKYPKLRLIRGDAANYQFKEKFDKI